MTPTTIWNILTRTRALGTCYTYPRISIDRPSRKARIRRSAVLLRDLKRNPLQNPETVYTKLGPILLQFPL